MRRTTAGPRPASTKGRSLWTDVRPVIVPMVVARVLVVVALVAAYVLAGPLSRYPKAHPFRNGLVVWDAAWYRDIAAFGYGPRSAALRFFPLTPLLTRLVDPLLPGGAGVALVVVANAAAVAFLALFHRLTWAETRNAAAARRAVWLGALAPSAFVLVLGYSESLLLLLTTATFLAVRRDRFWLAVPTGFLAGLARPIGALLALPVAIEALRTRRGAGGGGWLGAGLATMAPVAGLFSYLLWVQDRGNGLLAPFRLQYTANLKGETVDPVRAVLGALGSIGDGRVGPALHLAWVTVAVGLCVVAIRRLPLSYGAFAAVALAAALTSRNLDSFERYALGAMPLVMAAALVFDDPRIERPLLVTSALLMTAYATLAFVGVYVP